MITDDHGGQTLHPSEKTENSSTDAPSTDLASLNLAALNLAVASSPTGIAFVDDAWRFTYVNDAICKILAATPEELLGTCAGTIARLRDRAQAGQVTAFITDAIRHTGPENGLGLLLLDVDHFKRINDGLGHDEGDRLLNEVTARLRKACRTTDLAARFGSDEFVIIARGITTPEATRSIVEKVESTLSRPIVLAGRSRSRPASASPARSTRRGPRSICCRKQTPRCTAQRSLGAARVHSSTTISGPVRSNASNSRTTCAAPSRATRSFCTSNRWSTLRAGCSSAPRRSSAGSIRTAA